MTNEQVARGIQVFYRRGRYGLPWPVALQLAREAIANSRPGIWPHPSYKAPC
jgi:hypothetical protein